MICFHFGVVERQPFFFVPVDPVVPVEPVDPDDPEDLGRGKFVWLW